jgi:S-adenosylmethionine synthetase
MNYPLFTSESVCSGHPDKICDQISDAVLDEALKVDKDSRMALETLVTVNKVVMAGEVTCKQSLDYKEIAKKVIREIGYINPILNFDENADIEVLIHEQSKDIAVGVDNEGAGDQGMMFGYACKETPQLMPLPIVLASELCRKMDELQFGKLNYLRPDGKAEVSVVYDKGKVVEVSKIILAKPFGIENKTEDVKRGLYNLAVLPVLEKYGLNKVSEDKVILNGT